jgi:acetyl-CoA synthetase
MPRILTLANAAKPPITWMRSMQPSLSAMLRKTYPNPKNIYDALVESSRSNTPISCNFIPYTIDHWARQSSAGEPAIRCVNQDTGDRQDITYPEIVKRSHQIARFFKDRGFKKGDTVALMLGQRPAWWYSMAGLIRSGPVVVPFSRLLTSKDLRYRIQDLGIRGIITTPELQERIDAIRNECPSLEVMVTDGPAVPGWDALDDIFDAEVVPTEENTMATDPYIGLFTSGTTGKPKLVKQSQAHAFTFLVAGEQWLQLRPDDVVYNASDTGWGFNWWTTAATWIMGAKLLIAPTNKKVDPQKILAILRNEGVTVFCAAPTVLRVLAAQPNFDSFDFSTLKRICTVGEALDETILQKFSSRGIEVAVGYGQAETPLLIARLNDQPHVPGTMGKPVAPYKVVLLDENFCPVPPGGSGQIALDRQEGSSLGVMRGYTNAVEKTIGAFSPDGQYYLTGDYAKLGENSELTYLGRKDDMFKSNGYRVGPAEVEEAGMSHPAVCKIAVVGVRTDLNSAARTIKAFILLKPGYTASDVLMREIQRHIKNETAPNIHPRLVEFLDEETWKQYETISGKIRRAGLRERDEAKLLNKNAETNADTAAYSVLSTPATRKARP